MLIDQGKRPGKEGFGAQRRGQTFASNPKPQIKCLPIHLSKLPHGDRLPGLLFGAEQGSGGKLAIELNHDF